MTVNTIGSQTYIDGLKSALNDAKCVLDIAKAEMAGAQTAYDNAKSWKDLMAEYWERVQKTNELAEEILGCITRVYGHMDKVGQNTNNGNDTLNLLVNAAKLVSQCGDTLKSKVGELQYKIKCLDNQNLETSKGILKCLTELDEAITVAQTAACTAIEKSLDALEESCDLTTSINGTNGLKEMLQAIEINIKTGSKPGLRDPDLKPLGRKPKFPLTTMDCDYYDYVKKQSQDDEGKQGTAVMECALAKAELDEKRNVKDLAQAKYDAIDAALKAALAAKKC